MSPTLFDVLVDAVVWYWYEDVMEDVTNVNTGLRSDDVGCLASLFYADDGNDTYDYCPVDEAMEVCKLFLIQVYIAWRRQHNILTYVEKRTI